MSKSANRRRKDRLRKLRSEYQQYANRLGLESTEASPTSDQDWLKRYPRGTTCVYVLRSYAEHSDRYKIGTSTDLRKRLRDIQNMNPHPVHIFRAWSGGRKEETRLHRRVQQFRCHGEWFSLPAFFVREMRTTTDANFQCLLAPVRGIDLAKEKRRARDATKPKDRSLPSYSPVITHRYSSETDAELAEFFERAIEKDG